MVSAAVRAETKYHDPDSVIVGNHFGPYLELAVTTPHGSATQRLRWIQPGTFMMGSPESELGRFADEGPRHAVRLTQGFWLADTTCTQALWWAVMGARPSRFGGDERPVDRVTWADVQRFLRALEVLLPSFDVGLPTEGEWEYACRAGSDTPFSFGQHITPEQVNYDGRFRYAWTAAGGGQQGIYRAETVPVKSLPPNAWGLYEMHGNVWELCQDGQRQYKAKAVRDPVCPVCDRAPHIVRGGSWYHGGVMARSAYRLLAREVDICDGALGFRFCARERKKEDGMKIDPTGP